MWKKADDKKKIWEKFQKEYSSEFSEKKLDEIWYRAVRDEEDYRSTPQTEIVNLDRFGKRIPSRVYDLSYFLEYRVREERERMEEEQVMQKKEAFLTEWFKTEHDPNVVCCVLNYMKLDPDELINGEQMKLDSADTQCKVFEATKKQNKQVCKCLDMLMQMPSDSCQMVLKLMQEVLETKEEIDKMIK